ncbi:MAG: hypothetical protein U0640_08995 [Phycisphaerales bacterium]
MKPHPRIRKFFKWGGVGLSVLLVALWIGSAYAYWGKIECGQYAWTAMHGYFVIYGSDSSAPSLPLNFEYGPMPFKGMQWWGVVAVSMNGTAYNIPLWPFVLISIAATAAAWRMDTLAQRRNRQGKCKACGYDRGGLAAGAPCPECNAKA